MTLPVLAVAQALAGHVVSTVTRSKDYAFRAMSDEMDDLEFEYELKTLDLQSGMLESLGTFQVVKSVVSGLEVGQAVEIAYGDGPNFYFARLPERRVVSQASHYFGRWRPSHEGIEFGSLDEYEVTLWPTEPKAGSIEDVVAALDELRAPIMARMRHELGLPARGDDRFACLNCGRAASVVVTYDRLGELWGECHVGYGTWSKLIDELDGGTPRIVPGWMEINNEYGGETVDFDEATKCLEALVKRGIMNREGNGYVLAPPRCSNCMPAPLGIGIYDELFDREDE